MHRNLLLHSRNNAIVCRNMVYDHLKSYTGGRDGEKSVGIMIGQVEGIKK